MSDFVNYLAEVFQSFGAIRSRKMFGGYGVIPPEIDGDQK